MGYLKRLTPHQLTTAACGAVVTASIMLSHGNELGFLLLALATVCGIGAFAKSRDA